MKGALSSLITVVPAVPRRLALATALMLTMLGILLTAQPADAQTPSTNANAASITVAGVAVPTLIPGGTINIVTVDQAPNPSLLKVVTEDTNATWEERFRLPPTPDEQSQGISCQFSPTLII